jgi:hypothetical protein
MTIETRVSEHALRFRATRQSTGQRPARKPPMSPKFVIGIDAQCARACKTKVTQVLDVKVCRPQRSRIQQTRCPQELAPCEETKRSVGSAET